MPRKYTQIRFFAKNICNKLQKCTLREKMYSFPAPLQATFHHPHAPAFSPHRISQKFRATKFKLDAAEFKLHGPEFSRDAV